MSSSVNFDLQANLAKFQQLSERAASTTTITALHNITDEMKGLMVPRELSQYRQLREAQETLLNNLIQKTTLLEMNATSPTKKLMVPVFTGTPKTTQPSLPIRIPLPSLAEKQTEQQRLPSDTDPLPSTEATEDNFSETEPLLPPPLTQPQIPTPAPINNARSLTSPASLEREEARTSFPGLCFLSFWS